MSSNHPDPYAHLTDNQRRLADQFEQQAGADGADLKDLLDAADLTVTDKAALARAWGGPQAAAEYPTDTFEALAQRCETGARNLEFEADHAAEILPTRAGGNLADPQQWATKNRDAARAAREYAAALRAEAGDRPEARPDPARLAQAEQVARAAELGGILIDSRPMAERAAQSDSIYNRTERQAWQDGTHPAQQKAAEVEATGKFVHVAETINGVEQVPFWQLGGPVDEATVQRTNRREDEDEA